MGAFLTQTTFILIVTTLIETVIDYFQAFELAKAKLDVTELKNNLSQANKLCADKQAANADLARHNDNLTRQLTDLVDEKNKLAQQMDFVVARSQNCFYLYKYLLETTAYMHCFKEREHKS